MFSPGCPPEICSGVQIGPGATELTLIPLFASCFPKLGKETPAVPLKRAGQPAELAGIYVFLASEESSYVTSQIYSVSGGIPTA
jgi:NAD(P)-dependent dehydrogenase (short-subunit alcohol dehydrogenase family)